MSLSSLDSPPSIQAVHAKPVKPIWRGWLHLVWFELSLVVGTALVTQVPAPDRPAAIVYGTAVSGLFGASALYHRGNWRPGLFALYQRLDHSMIFLLIGGTATPIFLVAVGGEVGTIELITLWALTVSALLTRLVWTSAPEVTVGATYIGLGGLGAAALPSVWMNEGVAVFALLLGGGLLYILGAVLYLRRWPDPRPDVFGFHEFFHVFVCVAASAHYTAIALILR